MKKEKQPKHTKRNIVLLILLAALCIGGVELAACRHFAPEHYQRITAPVRRGVQAAVAFCQSAAGQAAQFCGEVAASIQQQLSRPEPEEEPPESQLASDPTLWGVLPVTDPSITDLTVLDGHDVLTGGVIDIVYYNQGDEAWASQPYGSDNIGGYGCGPTAMAMIVSSMTGEETDPAAMARWAVEQGYWARRSGSHHSIVEGTARAYGLQAESFPGRTPDDVMDALLAGKILVALMGPGHFTQRGHFIILRGVTLTGEILVADPNSLDRSLSVWDPQLILDELSTSTNNGAPLWSVSAELPPL